MDIIHNHRNCCTALGPSGLSGLYRYISFSGWHPRGYIVPAARLRGDGFKVYCIPLQVLVWFHGFTELSVMKRYWILKKNAKKLKYGCIAYDEWVFFCWFLNKGYINRKRLADIYYMDRKRLNLFQHVNVLKTKEWPMLIGSLISFKTTKQPV